MLGANKYSPRINIFFTPHRATTMRHSCNGCRTLRKGCRENCIIRPCLEWIKSPEAQGNATLFLAKFYGRAGLHNLINAAPQHLRPGLFKSLLYEACGRIANPAYGSLGLFWSGEWARCQAAVDAVLSGAQINVMEHSHSQVTGAHGSELVLAGVGIRHVSRDVDANWLKGKEKVKGKLKRTGNVIKPKPRVGSVDSTMLRILASSHERRESSAEPGRSNGDDEEIMEAMLMDQEKPSRNGGAELNLDLTLG